jgi:hypothetical protein
VSIVDTVHVPGELNMICDRLSRRGPSGEFPRVGDVASVPDLALGNARSVQALLELCDPKLGLLQDREFEDFWTRAVSLVASV